MPIPSGSTEVRFDVSMPPAGTLTVSVDDPGGIPADDQRYVLLDPPPAAAVGVVTDGGRTGAGAFYLERALTAGEDTAAFAVTALSPETLSIGDLSSLEVIVLIGTQGLERSGRERLAAFAANGGGVTRRCGTATRPAAGR